RSMSVRIPPPRRSPTGCDPDRNPESTGTAVSVETPVSQLHLCESVSQGVLQGALQSHLNTQDYRHPHNQNAAREVEQLLQMQVNELQKALHEQNALLHFLNPGLILSPTFLTQYEAYSLAQHPETDLVSQSDGVIDCKKCFIIRAGVEQDVPGCGPQLTRCTDHTSLQTVSTEQKRLSPIKEEFSEPGEEAGMVSPFGVRRKVPRNPEERPIRPGLKETEKTFEDFVEEQLRLDKDFIKKDKQLRTAEKKNFLRKGDGRSRISQSKGDIQKIQAASKIHRPSTSCPVQNSDQSRCMNRSPQTRESSSSALENLLLKKKRKAEFSEQKSGQENLLRNNVTSPHAKSLYLNNKKHSSPKTQEIFKQPNKTRSTKMQDGCVMLSGRKVASRIHLLEERIGFKTVNDRIVRVCDLEEATTKTLSLTTEIKKLFLQSSSGSDSTGAEEDPKPPTSSNPSDDRMDQSDEDYASDAPSDAETTPECPRATRCFSAHLSTSSGSEDGSDSELQRLSWSEPHKDSSQRSPKETSTEATTFSTRSSELLARIFPQVKSKTDNKLWETASGTQHSVNRSEPVEKVQEDPGSDIRDGTSDDLMMDKMKTEQDKALNFIRCEMDHFSNSDKDSVQNFRPSDQTPQASRQHLNKTEDLREEVQFLKEQLKRRECEWWQAHSELQIRVDSLSRENQELMKSQRVVHVRPQRSSGRSTPHPDARNLQTRRHSSLEFNNSQGKDEQKILPTRRDSSNSRTSTASQSPDDSDTILYSEYREKGSCRSPKKNIGAVIRNSVPKALKNTLKSGKSGSSESDYGSTDMNEDLLNSEMKLNNTQVDTKAVVREETRYPDGKVEQLLSDGSRVIVFRNGTRKEIGADQKSITVTFFNGDVKRVLADGTTVYYYCDARTTHSIYPSGLEVLQFPNKQIEKRHPDGTREILFPDGTIKTVYGDGRQESSFPDGTVVKLAKNGEKTVEFTNGQREIHTSQYKQRIYPDGTIKTVYLNGRQETKYSSGKIHIKNSEDVVMTDRK
ncbi:centromere protein J, partial [Tachysurus vachellii]|uniref:centromere protein J n=1 Tax=Tachysurus vachellii TaxID=175792 RepID=UPI00296B4E28